MKAVTLNPEQRLYVIPSGDGYSCFGFDNCLREATELSRRLNIPIPPEAAPESLALYDFYRDLITRIGDTDLGTWFDSRTPEKVRKVLEWCRVKRTTVRLWLGDPESGLSWMEECDVLGTIGRSMGPLKIPLLIPKGEHGGGGILDARVIRVMDWDTRKDLYRHPQFHLPVLSIVENPSERDRKKLPFAVLSDGETHAAFSTFGKAAAWCAFMTGEAFIPDA